MERIFITHGGKFYKAEKKLKDEDAEVNFPTGDMLKALTATPISREEMLGIINHVNFNKEVASLANPPEPPNATDLAL